MVTARLPAEPGQYPWLDIELLSSLAARFVYPVEGTYGVPRRPRAFSCNSNLRITCRQPRCRVFRALAGSDRNGATRPRPESPADTVVLSFADYVSSTADRSLTPFEFIVPREQCQAHQGGQGPTVPSAKFAWKGHQGGCRERAYTGNLR